MKVLLFGDSGVPTGFGRICDEVGMRLHQRGYHVLAVSLPYDGLMPAQYEGQMLPYFVSSLAGKPNWIEPTMAVINAWQPDVVVVCQDFPYAEQIFLSPLDWSRMGRVIVTPVDGKPLYPNWVKIAGQVDAVLTISQFGVEAMREAGIHARLCRPGVNGNTFFRQTADVRAENRAKLGLTPGAFLMGTMAMNQGRKAIPQMMAAFFDFAKDKPEARYLMDMEPQSPAGWDLRALCQQNGWDAGRLIFRADAARAGLSLNDRYNLLDVHAVVSFREGYGLPLVEAMACGVVSMALDWCSGTEVLGQGRGALVKTLEGFSPSTWGGALDKMPDVADMTRQLQFLYDHPAERAAIAERGMAWSRAQSWDAAADVVMDAIEQARAVVTGQAVVKPVEPPKPLAVPVIHTNGAAHLVPLVEVADGL